MKISKNDFASMIKEAIMQKLNENDAMSSAQFRAGRKSGASDSTATRGINNKELGLIQQLDDLLQNAAKETNILSGPISQRLRALMVTIKKVLGGEGEAPAGGAQAEEAPLETEMTE